MIVPKTYVIVLWHGRSDRSASARRRPRRGFLADHGLRRLGVVVSRWRRVAVHAVVEGSRRCGSTTSRALSLLGGDIALIREDTRTTSPTPPARRAVPSAELLTPGTGVSRQARRRGEDDRPAAFFCGAYRFEGDLCGGLLEALPATLLMRPAAGSTLRATLDLLAREMLRDDPGQQALLDRLLDVALVQILREHLTAARRRPRVVPGRRRPADRRRAQRAARRPGASMDGGRARRARADVALGVRAPLHRDRRGRPAHLPERLADGARPRAPARGRRRPRGRGAVARLRVGVLVRGGVQTPPRDAPGRWRTRARAAVVGDSPLGSAQRPVSSANRVLTSLRRRARAAGSRPRPRPAPRTAGAGGGPPPAPRRATGPRGGTAASDPRPPRSSRREPGR